MTDSPPLSRDEIRRYSRHLLIPDVGLEGQQKLRAARVLCVGAGGLGSPVATYLAAAGIGTLGLVDHDVVDFSNLQRQILHGTPDVGRPKLESARDRLRALNPGVHLELHPVRLDSRNALDILGRYDVIVDGTDNFPARYLINDACVLLGRPDVFGSVFRFEGQASVFATSEGPCYRCLFPEPPPPGLVPSCAEGGVLGVLPGIVGAVQAAEAIKLVIGAGDPLVGRVLLVDGLRMRFREMRLGKDPECPACGTHPVIRALIDYDAFCGVGVEAASVEFDLSPEEFQRRIEAEPDPQILDVREPQEQAINRIPRARLVPLGELPAALSHLDPTRDVFVYCRIGIRSGHAVGLLRGAGFRAWNLAGGIAEWIRQFDSDQPIY